MSPTPGEPLSGAVALPDGTLVRGRGRREPLPPGPVPDWGLYLGHDPDLPRRRLRLGRGTGWRPDWPAEWVEWPDFRTPGDDVAAAAAIGRAYGRARAGERVEVACGGGVGRTGTVIACLAVLAGHPAEDALAWTREHYRRRAVETPGQRRWIAWFAAHRPG
jgi:rhodanese/phosphatase family protein